MLRTSARFWLLPLTVLVAAAALSTTASASDSELSASCAAPGESLRPFAGAVADVAGSGDLSATVDWGDGTGSAGSVAARGDGYGVSGGHTYGSTGRFTVTTTVTDGAGETATTSCDVLVYGYAPGGGAFVVGDQTARGAVTFWGAQWWKQNAIGGGTTPPSFKGFAIDAVAAPTCSGSGGSGSPWSTDPGNSTPPPAGPLPEYMAVIVSSAIDKDGPRISGNTVRVVVVHTDPGYDGNPGHEGTGTVVATVSASGCDL